MHIVQRPTNTCFVAIKNFVRMILANDPALRSRDGSHTARLRMCLSENHQTLTRSENIQNITNARNMKIIWEIQVHIEKPNINVGLYIAFMEI